jgi:hypothetical protein
MWPASTPTLEANTVSGVITVRIMSYLIGMYTPGKPENS